MHTELNPPEDPRVRFAAERTVLAWIRTGLAMMGFGFVVAKFGVFLRDIAGTPPVSPAHTPIYSLLIGAALVGLGVAVNFFAAIGHVNFLRRHNAGLPYQPPKYSLVVITALVLAAAGVAMVIYLIYFPNHLPGVPASE
jgi:putative membrane protein